MTSDDLRDDGRNKSAVSAADWQEQANPTQTLGEAVETVRQALSNSGIDDPHKEARATVALAAGCSSLDILTEPQMALSKAAQDKLAKILTRRLAHEPLSRIAGWREFYGRKFHVSPATLDPRADSETLIDAVLELLDKSGQLKSPLRILDVGTGTGCLAITLLAELPETTATACDISTDALAIAEQNGRRLGVADRLTLVESNLLQNIEGQYNLVISNPPYIPTADIERLDRNVRDFDPQLALDGGEDGLLCYRELAKGLKSNVLVNVPPGLAVFEVGAGQAPDVTAILRTAGFSHAGSWKDLGGQTRCVAVWAHG
ncbi:MAG: peptide chain release factor N(5)-glutamine methyltransferase [Filomicrobium sp.]